MEVEVPCEMGLEHDRIAVPVVSKHCLGQTLILTVLQAGVLMLVGLVVTAVVVTSIEQDWFLANE